MEVASLSYLYVMMLTVASKATRNAGDCIAGSKVTHRPFSDTIVNHTLVGPVMSSITAKNERECEMECHLAVPDKCYMFNYHPSSKVCELLYKERAADYKVEKKKRSTFKTRRCEPRACVIGTAEQCVALGDQNNTLCLNFTGRVLKANTAPVCIGAKDDSYGTFFAPTDGKIKTFKLVHISGGVRSKGGRGRNGKWGTLTSSGSPDKICLHVTDHQNSRITPPSGYPVITEYGLLSYDVPGFNNMSPELVFPEISPLLAVAKGKEFRIWFGQDLTDAPVSVTTRGKLVVMCSCTTLLEAASHCTSGKKREEIFFPSCQCTL